MSEVRDTPTEPEENLEETGARYAYFVAKLDCQVCENEIEVEGDVSNGDTVWCDVCQAEREVFNR